MSGSASVSVDGPTYRRFSRLASMPNRYRRRGSGSPLKVLASDPLPGVATWMVARMCSCRASNVFPSALVRIPMYLERL